MTPNSRKANRQTVRRRERALPTSAQGRSAVGHTGWGDQMSIEIAAEVCEEPSRGEASFDAGSMRVHRSCREAAQE